MKMGSSKLTPEKTTLTKYAKHFFVFGWLMRGYGSLAESSMTSFPVTVKLLFFPTQMCLSMAVMAQSSSLHGVVIPKVFDVTKYGAVADGKTDDAVAFLRAWTDACQWRGRSRVWIPWGTYMISSVVFVGPCWNDTQFVIKGVLRAPTDPSLFFIDHWISFRYVDRLVVKGGGYLDGQGSVAWHLNDCFTNPFCKQLPISLRFDFVTNSRVHHIRSINSKNAHFNLFACKNINISHVRLTAPDSSPNTDGIHIGRSSNVKIHHSTIETGDDCVSMIIGSQNIDITEVVCGPGHGFSVGSLGKGDISQDTKDLVTGITVRNCTLRGTQNGLRIKTWAPSDAIEASDFVFENVIMDNVNNPIIIDQQYCPQTTCNSQAQSKVQISNVTFRNIWGTSTTQDAVSIKCSGLVPCKNIKLIDINLAYNGPGGPATSSCENVDGESYGTQLPSGCLL